MFPHQQSPHSSPPVKPVIPENVKNTYRRINNKDIPWEKLKSDFPSIFDNSFLTTDDSTPSFRYGDKFIKLCIPGVTETSCVLEFIIAKILRDCINRLNLNFIVPDVEFIIVEGLSNHYYALSINWIDNLTHLEHIKDKEEFYANLMQIHALSFLFGDPDDNPKNIGITPERKLIRYDHGEAVSLDATTAKELHDELLLVSRINHYFDEPNEFYNGYIHSTIESLSHQLIKDGFYKQVIANAVETLKTTFPEEYFTKVNFKINDNMTKMFSSYTDFANWLCDYMSNRLRLALTISSSLRDDPAKLIPDAPQQQIVFPSRPISSPTTTDVFMSHVATGVIASSSSSTTLPQASPARTNVLLSPTPDYSSRRSPATSARRFDALPPATPVRPASKKRTADQSAGQRRRPRDISKELVASSSSAENNIPNSLTTPTTDSTLDLNDLGTSTPDGAPSYTPSPLAMFRPPMPKPITGGSPTIGRLQDPPVMPLAPSNLTMKTP